MEKRIARHHKNEQAITQRLNALADTVARQAAQECDAARLRAYSLLSGLLRPSAGFEGGPGPDTATKAASDSEVYRSPD